MSNLSGKLGLITGLYVAAALSQHEGNPFNPEMPKKKNKRPVKVNPELKDQDFTGKGLKKFYYGDQFIWAINKKNADKKAKKLGINTPNNPDR